MEWKQKNTEHYFLFYHPDSVAEKRIEQISEWQEQCYQRLSQTLEMCLSHPIRMYLCESAEELAHSTGCPPCNGMTFDYDLIYAVYNDQIQCLGPHEDAHIFSYQIAIPESAFLKEGFAMYFDESYHGRNNNEIAKEWLKSKESFSITSLIDNDVFLQFPEEIAYPLAGAFTAWIIQKYGIQKYLEVYRNKGNFITCFEVASHIIDDRFSKNLTEG